MMRLIIGFLVMIMLAIATAAPAWATLRYVSGTGAGAYTAINAAASAAVSGDTILVGPGTFATGGINESKRLTYIGAGWDQTRVDMGSNVWSLSSTACNRTSIEGMRIEGSSTVIQGTGNVDSTVIRRCLLRSTGNVFLYWGSGQTGRGLTVEDCIILCSTTINDFVFLTDQNYPSVFRNCVFSLQLPSTTTRVFRSTATSGTLELYNCTFINWSVPFFLNPSAPPMIAINNMFYDWGASPSFGTYNASSLFDYNASQTVATPGTHALSITTNPFVNYDPAGVYVEGTSDLHLDPTNGAAFINSGHPGLLDFGNGTQSDRGVYGGPKPLVDNGVPNYPWAVNILLTPNLVGVGTPVNATALGRVGPQY